MRITEGQLRRIIREEARRLLPESRVAAIPPGPLAWTVDAAVKSARSGEPAQRVFAGILADLRATFASHRMDNYDAVPEVIRMLRPLVARPVAAELEALAMDEGY